MKETQTLTQEEAVTLKKALVVEDHRDLGELITKILRLIGWDAILAHSGREALDKLEHHSPHVILLDIRMPVMDGFELAGILKKHPLHNKTPILAASAYPGHRPPEHCGGL